MSDEEFPLLEQEAADAAETQRLMNEPKGLRAKVESQATEIADLKAKYEADVGTLKTDAMSNAYEALGLGETHGLRKAANLIFDGTPEELPGFMEQEFQYSYTGQEHPYQSAISNGHAALEQVGSTAGSVSPPTESDMLAVAEANHDTATSMAIKSRQLEKLLRP